MTLCKPPRRHCIHSTACSGYSCGTQGMCWPHWQTGQPRSSTRSSLQWHFFRSKCDEPRKCDAQLNSVMLSSDQTSYHSFVLGNTIVGLNATHLSPSPWTACPGRHVRWRKTAGPLDSRQYMIWSRSFCPSSLSLHSRPSYLHCSCHRMPRELVVFLIDTLVHRSSERLCLNVQVTAWWWLVFYFRAVLVPESNKCIRQQDVYMRRIRNMEQQYCHLSLVE